ncbi:LysE family transporter [Gordonia sp. VNK1]|uniref:LysE/ArgO family amino acid transporter n=1 Tax=Gordonia oleivorans TaxID=3156618 RepID=UPI0032B48D2C
MSGFWMPALAGLLTGAGLIIAIGPQNVFVLRQGVRRAHVAQVVAVCAVSDVVLITAGVAGLGALVSAHPALITVATLLGGAYVIVLGLMAAKRSLRSGTGMATDTGEAATTSRWMAIGTALALTWLNPHVYLDTVLTMGAIANGHGNGKWAFAIGACVASILWFTILGGGSRRMAPLFAKPRAWRILDAVVAVIMIGMGAALIASV